MLLKAGRLQLLDLEPNKEGPLHTAYKELLRKYDSTRLLPKRQPQAEDMSRDDLEQLQALASPRLLTVHFNSW